MMALLHCLALGSLFFYQLLWLQITGALFIILSALHVLRRFVLLLDGNSITEICWEDEAWSLKLRSGIQLEVALLPSSVLTPGLTLLHFARTGPRRYFSPPLISPLFVDSADADSLRRLRMRIRHGQQLFRAPSSRS